MSQSSSRPGKEGIAAKSGDSGTAQRQPAAPSAPLPVVTSGTRAPSERDPAQTGGEGPHWAEWALVFVTGVLAVYTYRLWRATNTLARDGRDAATEQTKLTREAIELAQSHESLRAG